MRHCIVQSLVLALFASTVTLTGCGGKPSDQTDEQASGRAGEGAAVQSARNASAKGQAQPEAGSDPTTVTVGAGDETVVVKVDGEGEAVSLEAKGEEFAVTVGERVKVPDNFPKDVPVCAGLELSQAMETDDGFMLQGTTSDTVKQIADHYAKTLEANGWTEEMTIGQSGPPAMSILTYSKDGREGNVTATETDEGTVVAITVAR